MTGYTPPTIKPVDNQELIAVLCPTRGRPELLKKAIASFNATGSQTDLVEFWLMIDDDDDQTLAMLESDWTKASEIPVHANIGSRPLTLADGTNQLWQAASNAGIYLLTTDDYLMQTPEWDRIVREAYAAGPTDRLSIYQLNCPDRPSDDLILWTVSAEWLNICGRFLAPYFPYWFTDMWVDHVATITGRKQKLPIDMIAQGDEDHGTQGIWRLDYWYRLFHLLLCERVEEAHKIITAIHQPGSDDLRLALEQAEEAVHHFEKWALSKVDDKKLTHIEAVNSQSDSLPGERAQVAFQLAHQHFQAKWPDIRTFFEERELALDPDSTSGG